MKMRSIVVLRCLVLNLASPELGKTRIFVCPAEEPSVPPDEFFLQDKYHLMVGSGVFTGPSESLTDSFYTLNLSVLKHVYEEWTEALPHVKPYYAVKCNPTPAIVEALAKMGSNFDCASPAEIQQVLDLGVEPERILYANPCKRVEDIRFAKMNKITRTTFDSVCELKKMAAEFPEMKLFLRIRADDPSARCNLGVKYGAEEHEWDVLLFTARALGLEVVGVSLHVGSFASSPKVFGNAVKTATRALKLARKHGYDPRIIDIGGGFSATHGLPKTIKAPKGIELIAEPGRFFVERVMELHTPVIGTKGSGLTVSESLYGAFNCILFDHAAPQVKEVRDELGNKIEGQPIKRTIFGSTCDGGDVIYKEYELPEGTDLGSWITWENMGAYTCAATTRFNGIAFNDRYIKCIDA
jgi:ornithine decarboxylase